MRKDVCVAMLLTGLIVLVGASLGLANTSISVGADAGFILPVGNQIQQNKPFAVLGLKSDSLGVEGGMNIPDDLKQFSESFKPDTYFLELLFYAPIKYSPFSLFAGTGAIMGIIPQYQSAKLFLLDVPIGVELSGVNYGLPLTMFASVDFIHFAYTTLTNTSVVEVMKKLGGIEFTIGLKLEFNLFGR